MGQIAGWVSAGLGHSCRGRRQTISELYEHDGDKDRPALGALLARMTAAYRGPVRRVREAA